MSDRPCPVKILTHADMHVSIKLQTCRFTDIELGVRHMQCKCGQETEVEQIDSQVGEIEPCDVSGPFPAQETLYNKMHELI